MPCLDFVGVDGDTTLVFRCEGASTKHVADLAGWIATGGETLAPLKDARLFRTAAVAEWGTAVAWDGAGDLMIDVLHLVMLASRQRPLHSDDAAAERKAHFRPRKAGRPRKPA